jgi:DNA-binding MarR family transcriptional regulator
MLTAQGMNKMDGKLKASHDSSLSKEVECFRKAGFSGKAADAIVRIDSTMARIRRSMIRRELVVEILKELDPNLDLSRLDVMVAVMHWHPEDEADAFREITVGAVAERLGIDPSRASRLVADVIDLGYIRRTASQADSRRIVLEPTDKGVAFGEEFRARKSKMLSNGLQGWTEEELVLFAKLVDRFSFWGKTGLNARPKASE